MIDLLERKIERAAFISIYHTDKEERKKAWDELKRLHKQRSPERIKEMEKGM